MQASFITFAVITTVAATTATAGADSPDNTQREAVRTAYVTGGVSAGIQRDAQFAFLLEGGKAYWDERTFVRGQLTRGDSGGPDGAYSQLRVGVERRHCTRREWLCRFAGLDIGYQHDLPKGRELFADYDDVSAHDVIAVPRIGFEAGRDFKFRASFELPLRRRLDTRMDDDTSSGGVGGTLSVGIGKAF